ncbi:hypothetical protein TrispH2_004730 [Trichoplax sp. H2]|nr:hypothetical protein TrispH2_004730 [Trichoplax sp. H2]|eukprot:RDD43838.1 hypothetical protein TrispH2_004730 [Trichoplax sp. H2]
MSCQCISEWVSFVVGIILLLCQLGSICSFFYTYVNPLWALWWGIPGGVIFIYWSFATFKPVNFANEVNHGCALNCNGCPQSLRRFMSRVWDKLSHCYIIWLIYGLYLVIQVLTLFICVTDRLDEKFFLGPRMLKLVLSITPALFVVFVYAHHDRDQLQSDNYYVAYLVYQVGLDLFDAVEMLENLFAGDEGFKVSVTDKWLILIFSCINFLLPTLALCDLCKHIRGLDNHYVTFKVIYKVFSLIINVFYLVMRVILWDTYKKDISVLFMKNIITVVLHIKEVFHYCLKKDNGANSNVV